MRLEPTLHFSTAQGLVSWESKPLSRRFRVDVTAESSYSSKGLTCLLSQHTDTTGHAASTPVSGDLRETSLKR